jgi:hypothetical protein
MKRRSNSTEPAINDCIFYHSIDLPGLGTQRGEWDLRGRFTDYIANVPIGGASLLDVGTASGFLTFEAERHGATVTSFDADSVARWRGLPIAGASDKLYGGGTASLDEYFRGIRNSYRLSHRLMQSKASVAYGDICELNPNLGIFDVVLIGQVLVHIRDGISALEAAASVCRRTMIIVEGCFDSPHPAGHLLAQPGNPLTAFAIYLYSRRWYETVLRILGFSDIQFSTAKFACNVAGYPPEIELTTVVAKRPH